MIYKQPGPRSISSMTGSVLLDDQGFRSCICNSEITSLENDGDGDTQCIVVDQSQPILQ